MGHEPQPNTGNCHLHGLVDSYLPVEQLRSEWMAQGGGQSVDIERVDDIAACADYMLAYCGEVAAASTAVPV